MELKVVIEMEEKTRICIEKLTEALTTGESVINISSPQIVEKTAEVVKKATKSKAKSKVEEPVMTPQDTAITDEIHKENEVSQAPVEAPTPQPTEQPKQEEPKKTEPLPTVTAEYTRSDLARVGRELAMNGKRDEVLKAFTKFHAASLADIKTEDFNALAQIYIELGGKF